MNDLQREMVRAGVTGRAYAKIATVFDQLPDRFQTKDVCNLLGVKQGMGQRAAFAAVLSQSFKCRRTASGVWIKP